MDRKIKCQDCDKEFIFNEGEQEFYNNKHLTPPKRCKSCREKRKERRTNNG